MNFLKRIMFVMALGSTCFATVDYDAYFTDYTMRVDYYHTGTDTEEYFSVDQIYKQGQWSGTRTNLIDSLNLGKYYCQVYDYATERLIYSRGYCTVFGEWQTTTEAEQKKYRTMHETVLFPFPQAKVRLIVSSRNKQNALVDQFETVIDPDSRFINRETQSFPYTTRCIMNNGPSTRKVDIVVLGDGYTRDETKTYQQHVQRLVENLFSVSPFKENVKAFNVWTIESVSTDSGIDEPRKKQWKNTILNTSFNSLDSPRYILSLDNRTIRDIASLVPYDYIYILVNSGRYGGGGIYNWYATSYTSSHEDHPDWWVDYVMIHEFGHLFAGLADEYYTSDIAYVDFYSFDTETWEPNITPLLDPNQIKWGEMIKADTPIPTSWNKATFDSLSSEYRRANKSAKDSINRQIRSLLENHPNAGKVGCFEGAGYVSEGLYRSYIDCIMFSKSLVEFCPVCQNAIIKMINYYTN